MKEFKYIFGPVPSRRLGISVGVSPIPRKCCNYSCVYCQLGRTDKMTNDFEEFFSVLDIVKEFNEYLEKNLEFDVVTIVGEGEPTLYANLGELILELKKITDKPIVVITNGSVLYEKKVQENLMNADIVMPSIDAYDEVSFKKINRPYGRLHFKKVYDGLVDFSNKYRGQLWLETMIIKGLNDDKKDFIKMKKIINNIKYEKLYINTPVRPPAEEWVEQVSSETMNLAVEVMGGISIDMLDSSGFFSEENDDYDAILSIIRRHPMNQYEIENFMNSRKCSCIPDIFKNLEQDDNIQVIEYKGYKTYRLKV